MKTPLPQQTLSGGSMRRLVSRVRCWWSGHDLERGKYADGGTWAECRCCHRRWEPLPREDGCTPVWDNWNNAYKCVHSSHHGAKAWGGKCPAHSAGPNLSERNLTMDKIYLRNPTTEECHIVTITESGPEIMDAVLDQFNLSSMEIIDEARFRPAPKMMTLDLCDPRDSSRIIGTLETTFFG